MELRHLRYFIAVAEEGSLTLAAARRLHTAQPSLSRQIRDLEAEVGAKLLARGSRGIELTQAGRIFLDHARLVLLQVEAAGAAARCATQPASTDSFVLGFLPGQEMIWLSETLRILHDGMPGIDVRLLNQASPDLAGALMRGSVDVAFLRREERTPGLAFKLLLEEPIVLAMPRDHRLAKNKMARPQDWTGETFIQPAKGNAMRAVIDIYAAKSGVKFSYAYEADNLPMAITLVASTRSLVLLPASARNLLPASVVCRPLLGEVPTVDLVVGYSKANSSPLLKKFLSRVDELIEKVSKQISAITVSRISGL